MSPEERFWAKVNKTDSCWLWTASTNAKGYGLFVFYGRMTKAHRLAYELLVGPIPDGLHIDHLCRVKPCVNPAHLEPVTNYENHHRWMTQVKTHCINGHEYTPENTILKNDRGWRRCRICRNESSRRHEARRSVPRQLSSHAL